MNKHRVGAIPLILTAILALVIAVGGVGIGLAWKTELLDKWLPPNIKGFFGRGENRGGEETTNDEQESTFPTWPSLSDSISSDKATASTFLFDKQGSLDTVTSIEDWYYNDIWVANADGSNARRLLRGDAENSVNSGWTLDKWSLDRTKVLLYSEQTFPNRIRAYNAYFDFSRNEFRRIGESGCDTPTGGFLLTNFSWKDNQFVILEGCDQFWQMNIDGTGKTLIADFTKTTGEGSFTSDAGSWDISPSGDKLVYDDRPWTGGDLVVTYPTTVYLYDLKENKSTRLLEVKKGERANSPHFLNEDWILFSIFNDDSGVAAIKALNVTTGEIKILVSEGDFYYYYFFPLPGAIVYLDLSKQQVHLFSLGDMSDRTVFDYGSISPENSTPPDIAFLSAGARWLVVGLFDVGSYLIDLSDNSYRELGL